MGPLVCIRCERASFCDEDMCLFGGVPVLLHARLIGGGQWLLLLAQQQGADGSLSTVCVDSAVLNQSRVC
jgi:hypothetical protein